MRDMSRPDEKGQGRSRGYGFVDFTEHQHALACLRELNNNPNTFSNDKVKVSHQWYQVLIDFEIQWF